VARIRHQRRRVSDKTVSELDHNKSDIQGDSNNESAPITIWLRMPMIAVPMPESFSKILLRGMMMRHLS
jgi:hypothetical protein